MSRFSEGLGTTLLVAVLVAMSQGCGGAPVAAPETARGAEPSRARDDLIPREVLFGNPDRTQARISPDGSKLSFLAPVDGVLNVWVGPADDPAAARPVTEDRERGILIHGWVYTGSQIVYLQDSDGDENWHVYITDVVENETRDLTPIEGVRAQGIEISPRRPGHMVVGLNDRDPELHDAYRIDLESGERTLVRENPGFLEWVVDEELEVRFGLLMTPDGGSALYRPKAERAAEAASDPLAGWEVLAEIGKEDSLTTLPIGFDESGGTLYLVDSRGRDTSAFCALDTETGEIEVLAQDPRADAADWAIHPTARTVQAVAFEYDRRSWTFLDEGFAADMAALEGACDGDIEVTGRSVDDARWIVACLDDDGPTRYHLYERGAKETSFLFSSREALEDLDLAKMHPVVIEARDGLALVSYVSLPGGTDPDGDGRPAEPLPTVLKVHGGPWARANWGYDAYHQWLANRGYAVLDVNFRGSSGFGKGFLNAGDKEWAGKMHDDLLDAVRWAVEEGIADPAKVAIYGGSYGGYATLVGLTFTPEVFACGVDLVGPSSLVTLLETIPPYWAPMIEQFALRVGDHRTEEGRALLLERSPLGRVDEIVRPLLIGQGANDPRVKKSESDQIVAAMREKGIPVTYLLYSDEGHGFVRPENRISFQAVTEAFLSQCLGGGYQPVGGDFAGSTIDVPAGAEHVPGLVEALEAQEGE